MNSHPEEVWHILTYVGTNKTKVIATSLCDSFIPTDVFEVTHAFTPTTFQFTIVITTLEDPGN